MITERIVVSGRVQGVGFRATTVQLAQGRPVTGYVRNQRDGSVEVVAQGTEAAVRAFVDAIHDRFRTNILNTIRTRLESAESFEGFEIRY